MKSLNITRIPAGPQAYLHPSSEHILDWFHVTMRITVMNNQCVSIKAEDEEFGTDAKDNLERIKHYLWHGNVEEGQRTVESLLLQLEARWRKSEPVARLYRTVQDFHKYIRNNQAFIPTLVNATIRATGLARALWNPRSIRW